MLTPDGQSAIHVEKIMLLAIWAFAINHEVATNKLDKKMILAGIGKPTYPINQETINAYLAYWQQINKTVQEWHLSPESTSENPAVEYGDPRGDFEPRSIMADVMSKWYGVEVTCNDILFTVGGVAGLGIIFETLSMRYIDMPRYRIITPFPHYSVYANHKHILHPIDVMQNPGYKLTAESLVSAIKSAYLQAESDHGYPKAVLLCNPSNPLGNCIDEVELIKIAAILRAYPDLLVIFDEAYAEMCFDEMPVFLKVAPDLKERVIIMRSATKALSAAGERMAMLLVFDAQLMSEMLNKSIGYFVHSPRSAQIVYAKTMASFDENEHRKLIEYYKGKVDYVASRLDIMQANMPDPLYKVEASFYILADLSDLLGFESSAEVARALQRKGIIETDEELAYDLLFETHIMITPLSYLGLSPALGYFRITCSENFQELKELMDRIEQRLYDARKVKSLLLLKKTNDLLLKLANIDARLHEKLSIKMPLFDFEQETCASIKSKYTLLQNIDKSLVDFLNLGPL